MTKNLIHTNLDDAGKHFCQLTTELPSHNMGKLHSSYFIKPY